jgi:hypothetical protein
MYDGWVWRKEREREDALAQTFLLLKAWGSEKLKFEQLLGRPLYPVLRSVQTEPTKIGATNELGDSRTKEEKLAEVAELKEIFKDVFKPKKAEGDDDITPLLIEAGITEER